MLRDQSYLNKNRHFMLASPGLVGSVVALLRSWRKDGSVAGCTVAVTSIVHLAITTPPGIAASQKRPDIQHSWSGMPEKQVAPGEMSQYGLIPLSSPSHAKIYTSESRKAFTPVLCMRGTPQFSVS